MTDGKWIYVSGEDQERLRSIAGDPVGAGEDLISELANVLANYPGITEEEVETLRFGSVWFDPDPTCCVECSAQHKLRNPQGKDFG